MPYEHKTGVEGAFDRGPDHPEYSAVIFRDGADEEGQGSLLQGAELNEVQTILRSAIGRVGGLSARDGNKIEGADALVDPVEGKVFLQAGKVFADQDVHSVASTTLENIPMNGEVSIGVRIAVESVSPEDEPSLNGLAAGTEAEGEPGAWREKKTAHWGWSGDDQEGELYQVYLLSDGTILDNKGPIELDATQALLRLYDKEARGNYITKGCKVTALGKNVAGEQVFDIAAGTANVAGIKIRRAASLRIAQHESWGTERVDGEIHTYKDQGGYFIVPLNRSPLDSVVQVLVEKRTTETVVRGPLPNGSDSLSNGSIRRIVSIKQGSKTFGNNVDYAKGDNGPDWSLSGDEPSAGSSYNVTYDYLDAVTPIDSTPTTLKVSGGREDGEVIVTYLAKLPRVDIIALDTEGRAKYLKGQPARNPKPPIVPPSLLRLCEVSNDFAGKPTVNNNGTFAYPFDFITKLVQTTLDLHQLMIDERLKRELDAREPFAKKSILVDPFENDEVRDKGVAQNGAIVEGALVLPSIVTPQQIFNFTLSENLKLPHELKRVINQPQSTVCKPINRFGNIEKLPASMIITPAVDQWTETEEVWQSPITRRVTSSRNSVTTITRVVDERQTAAEFLRALSLSIVIEDFFPGENLTSLTFDGQDFTPGPIISANDDGRVEASIDIPANTFPAGVKMIEAKGQGGSFADGEFVGEGTIETEVLQRVTTVSRRPRRSDPRGQIIRFPKGASQHFARWSVKFCAIGDVSKPVIAQLRPLNEAGYPIEDVIDQVEIDMSTIELNAWSHIDYPNMPFVEDLTGVASVLLTQDTVHAISAAKIGEFDKELQQQVVVQPFSVGQEIESSTATTWAPVNDSDLTFQVWAPRFTSEERRVLVGTSNLTSASEFLVKAGVELPTSGCSVHFELELDTGRVITLEVDRPVELDAFYSGSAKLYAVLKGTATASPTLFRYIQFVTATMDTAADYVSRTFSIKDAGRVPVRVMRHLPVGSSLKVSLRSANGAWVELAHKDTQNGQVPGWDEALFEPTSLAAFGDTTAVKLEFSGTPAARPHFANLNAAGLLI
ncbi:DUF4815 domain-containing protein [Pseudovibrio ascidiaceicola]|uniref:DUF4815 domain-containing protein n=1 Tax=Pseudovibrio ascidiaceicola TaxID=285279 RepID=UPI003D36E2F4